MKPTPETKIDREMQLITEIRQLNERAAATIHQYRAQASAEDTKSVIEHTTAVGNTEREMQPRREQARRTRDAAMRQADKDRTAAIREAKSRFDADLRKAQDAYRDEILSIDTVCAHANAPHANALAEKRRSLIGWVSEMVQKVQDEHKTAVTPLETELAQIRAARGATGPQGTTQVDQPAAPVASVAAPTATTQEERA